MVVLSALALEEQAGLPFFVGPSGLCVRAALRTSSFQLPGAHK